MLLIYVYKFDYSSFSELANSLTDISYWRENGYDTLGICLRLQVLSEEPWLTFEITSGITPQIPFKSSSNAIYNAWNILTCQAIKMPQR